MREDAVTIFSALLKRLGHLECATFSAAPGAGSLENRGDYRLHGDSRNFSEWSIGTEQFDNTTLVVVDVAL